MFIFDDSGSENLIISSYQKHWEAGATSLKGGTPHVPIFFFLFTEMSPYFKCDGDHFSFKAESKNGFYRLGNTVSYESVMTRTFSILAIEGSVYFF